MLFSVSFLLFCLVLSRWCDFIPWRTCIFRKEYDHIRRRPKIFEEASKISEGIWGYEGPFAVHLHALLSLPLLLLWLNTYMIASAKEIDALNITLFNSCINSTNVHHCNYCTKIFVIVVSTCVCRRSGDYKALILSYPILSFQTSPGRRGRNFAQKSLRDFYGR